MKKFRSWIRSWISVNFDLPVKVTVHHGVSGSVDSIAVLMSATVSVPLFLITCWPRAANDFLVEPMLLNNWL